MTRHGMCVVTANCCHMCMAVARKQLGSTVWWVRNATDSQTGSVTRIPHSNPTHQVPAGFFCGCVVPRGCCLALQSFSNSSSERIRHVMCARTIFQAGIGKGLQRMIFEITGVPVVTPMLPSTQWCDCTRLFISDMQLMQTDTLALLPDGHYNGSTTQIKH